MRSHMRMRIYDKIRFTVIFFKSLWTDADALDAEIRLSDDGTYLLAIDDGAGSDTGMMYR